MSLLIFVLILAPYFVPMCLAPWLLLAAKFIISIAILFFIIFFIKHYNEYLNIKYWYYQPAEKKTKNFILYREDPVPETLRVKVISLLKY